MDCFGTYLKFTHVPNLWWNRVQSATEWTASVHTLHMSKPVMQLVFKVLRSGLLRCILYTCPNLWCNSCSKCYGMDCFGTYFTHVQTCDVTRVHSTCFRSWTWQKSATKMLLIPQRNEKRLKNEPHFQGPKNMDMLEFHANNNVLVTFFSAHCNCADFRKFLKCNVSKPWEFPHFLWCSQQFSFNKVMHPHARKTVRRVVFVAQVLSRQDVLAGPTEVGNGTSGGFVTVSAVTLVCFCGLFHIFSHIFELREICEGGATWIIIINP